MDASKYYRVKKGSKWDEACYKMTSFAKTWFENEDLQDFLKKHEIPDDDYLLVEKALTLLKVPKGYESQFRQPRVLAVNEGEKDVRRNTYTAKKTSQINREYLKVVEENEDIREFNWYDFKDIVELSLTRRIGFGIVQCLDGYYVTRATECLINDTAEGLEEITFLEWLKIHAETLESEKLKDQ